MPRVKRLRKPEKKRLWEEFFAVNPDDRDDVLRFCSPRNFILMLMVEKGPIRYVLVGEPDCEEWTFQEFRRWHQDFKKNIAPAAEEAQRLLDKSSLSERRRNRLRILLNLLSAKSYLYGSYVSPMLPPISQNDWPARHAARLQYVPAYPGVIGGSYWDAISRDRGEIERMTYEGAEGASYLADLHTAEDISQFRWAGTALTVGHVFVDLVQDLEGRGSILKCADCDDTFPGNAYQRRHANDENDVYCPKCSGINEGPQEYHRRLMRRRRHPKDKKDKGGHR